MASIIGSAAPVAVSISKHPDADDAGDAADNDGITHDHDTDTPTAKTPKTDGILTQILQLVGDLAIQQKSLVQKVRVSIHVSGLSCLVCANGLLREEGSVDRSMAYAAHRNETVDSCCLRFTSDSSSSSLCLLDSLIKLIGRVVSKGEPRQHQRDPRAASFAIRR
jgi:hypothetical protein